MTLFIFEFILIIFYSKAKPMYLYIWLKKYIKILFFYFSLCSRKSTNACRWIIFFSVDNDWIISNTLTHFEVDNKKYNH